VTRLTIVGLALSFAIAGSIAALALRSPERAVAKPSKKPHGLRAASELVATDAAPVTRERALEVATQLFAVGGVTRADVESLLRDAAKARKAGDHAACDELLAKLLALGPEALRWIAEVVLNATDEDEAYLAALALQHLATHETVPFVLALLRTDRPVAVLGVAIEILTRFRASDAAPWIEAILFRAEADRHLKLLSIDFFGAMGEDGVPVLARAIGDAAFGPLRERAAEALAKIGTPAAGQALFTTWRDGFDKSAATANYFLLKSLARFDPSILRAQVADVLRDDNASRINVFLSILARADRAFAIETVRSVLAADVARSTRTQAILVLGSIGGEEAEAALLDLIARPRGETDAAESANALLKVKRMHVPFERVHSLFASTEHPLLRAMLGTVLAKYDERLAGDRALALALVEEAARGEKANDPAQRGLSVQFSAQLARHTADPAGHLLALQDRIKPEEKDAHPSVFAELARHGADERVRPILLTSLADEQEGVHRRMMAADGLMRAGGSESIYQTIGKTKNGELATMLVGMTLAREGKSGAAKVADVARSIEDPDRRRAIEEQVRVFQDR